MILLHIQWSEWVGNSAFMKRRAGVENAVWVGKIRGASGVGKRMGPVFWGICYVCCYEYHNLCIC